MEIRSSLKQLITLHKKKENVPSTFFHHHPLAQPHFSQSCLIFPEVAYPRYSPGYTLPFTVCFLNTQRPSPSFPPSLPLPPTPPLLLSPLPLFSSLIYGSGASSFFFFFFSPDSPSKHQFPFFTGKRREKSCRNVPLAHGGIAL